MPQSPRGAGSMIPFAWLSALLDVVGSAPAGRSPRQCPAHVDAAPSLSLHERDGRVMIFCHAGCGWREVLAALRVPGSALHRAPPIEPERWAVAFCSHLSFPKLERGNGHPALNGYRLEAVHRYSTALLERWRHQHTGAKDLMWWTLTDDGRMPGLRGRALHELPLYNEGEARAALAMGEPVLLVESESSADALKGWVATTWAGGANAVPAFTIVDVLGDGTGVIMIPDMDVAGLDCAKGMVGTLPNIAMMTGAIGEDAKDLYLRVGKHDFATMVEEAMG